MTSVFAQEICYSLYRPNIEGSLSRSLDVVNDLNRIETQTAWLNRQLKKGEITQTYYQTKINRDFDKIEKKLLKGDSAAVKTQMRALYSKVEASYLRVLQLNRLSKILREAHQMGVVDVKLIMNEGELISAFMESYVAKIRSLDNIGILLREIDDEILRDARVLGKNFQRYETYELSLRKLSKQAFCNKACQQSIKELKSDIGVFSNSRRPHLDDLIGSETSVTLAKVQRVFNGNADALLVARKRELLKEGVDLLRRISSKFFLMQKFVNYLSRTVSPRIKPVYRMLRSIFDERYIKYHAKGIERVVNSDLSASAKYTLMKKETQALTEEAFWVDFSRLKTQKSKETWDEIKNYLSKKKSSSAADELLRMNEAQKIGEILGDPKRTNLKNAIRVLSTLAIVGGSVAYFSFDTEDEDGDSGDPTILPTGSGTDIDLDNGQNINTDSGTQVQGENENNEDDDEVTVLIDYLSPTDKEITEILSDTISIYQEIEGEKDSATLD